MNLQLQMPNYLKKLKVKSNNSNQNKFRFKYQFKSIIILFVLNIFLVTSCAVNYSKPKDLNCIVPIQNCNQNEWKGQELDTSYSSSKVNGYYYKISAVENINSENNEFAITNFGNNYNNRNLDKYAYLTYEQKIENDKFVNQNIQKNKKIRFASASNPVIEDIYFPQNEINSHFGLINTNSNNITNNNNSNSLNIYLAFSTFPKNKLNYQEIENTIGLSDVIEITSNSNTNSNDIFETINEKVSNLYQQENWAENNKIIDFYERKDTTDVNLFVSHPNLHPDNRVLFFTSNYFDFSQKETNFKGCEIYFIIKDKQNKWSKPINCGTNINTDCDDISPYVTKDGSKLLFSSMGGESVGGYDLFESIIDNNILNNIITNFDKTGEIDQNYIASNIKSLFQPSKNMGKPINTKFDETFPTAPNQTDSVLYYSSNQNTQNGFDIYVKEKIYTNKILAENSKPLKDEFEINSNIVLEQALQLPTIEAENNTNITNIKDLKQTPKIEKVIETINIEGKVRSQEDAKPIEGASVISQFVKNGEKYSETVSDKNGDYFLEIPKGEQIDIIAQKESKFYDKYTLKIDTGGTTKTIKIDFKLPEKLTLRINFPYDEFKEPYQFTLDSNGIETDETWEHTLDLLAQDVISTIDKIKFLEIIGHTDDIAGVEYNSTLGLNRAKFVSDELIKRGVDSNKIVVKSKGKSNLLPKKKDESLDIYRKRLRRVTFEKKI